MRRRDSIFFRLTLAFICLGLIPILAATVALYAAFTGNMEDVMLGDFSNLVQYAGDNISMTLEEYSSLTGEIYYQDVDDGVMLADFIKRDDVPEKEKRLTMNMVMQNILDEDSRIRTACFTDNSGNLSCATKNTQKVMDEERWREVMGRPRGLKDGIQVAVSHEDDYFSGSGNHVMTFICDVNDNTLFSKERVCLGKIYLDLDFSVISEMASDITINEEGIFRIVDPERVCIYSYDEKEIGKLLSDIPEPDLTGGEYQKYIMARGNYFVYYKIPGTEWTAEVQVSESAVMKNTEAVRIYVIIFLLVSVSALILVYRNYLKGIRRPIRRLIRGMNEIQGGNLKTRVELERRDELGNLAEGLNRMTEELDEYIQRVYVSELKQRETELDMLKTQIQPHYLYNTLEVIRMQAVSNDDPETAEMVESLSKQLRYLIGKTGDMVTLGTELENIREYFKLLRIRYERRFSLEIDVPDELAELYIVKLSLQPVVENAVKHGLLKRAGDGIVQISAVQDGKRLDVTVMDDGAGMEKNVLEELRRNIASDEEIHYDDGRPHLGVKNTAERLRKGFGKEYGIEIDAEPGIGTVVTIHYPVIAHAGEKADGDPEENGADAGGPGGKQEKI